MCLEGVAVVLEPVMNNLRPLANRARLLMIFNVGWVRADIDIFLKPTDTAGPVDKFKISGVLLSAVINTALHSQYG